MSEKGNLDYFKLIGANTRYERRKRKLTIDELSKFVDVAPGFLGLIERGKRGASIKNLCAMADFFGLTLDELIRRDIYSSLENQDEKVEETPKEKKYAAVVSLLGALEVEELDFVFDVIKAMKNYSIALEEKDDKFFD